MGGTAGQGRDRLKAAGRREMTPDEQGTHAAGYRELIRRLGEAGIISTEAIHRSGRGQANEEMVLVVARLEQALRRENEVGQKQGRRKGRKQIVKDLLGAIEGKQPRYLKKTRAGRKLAKLVRLMRKTLL
jgi:hypothetical protein